MGIIRQFLGPKSKYDRSIPYTYVAVVPVIEGDSDLANHYFSDTICGLIEYLQENNIEPGETELFACFQDKEIPIDIIHCTDKKGNWLTRPHICNSLETHYKKTLEEQYKGHIEEGECFYEDRSRNGSGPY